MNKLTRFALFLLLSISALGFDQTPPSAFEKIEGAFGRKLGEDFDPKSVVGSNKLTDGTPMYEFIPERPYKAFSRYYVMITPKTKKIYSIWGIGSAEADPEANHEMAVVMKLLSEKYGPEEKQSPSNALGDIRTIRQGGRYVMTKVSGIFHPQMDVRYYDVSLEKLAKEERLALESEKAEKGGL